MKLRLEAWKTYFYFKLLYPLMALRLMNPSQSLLIDSRISMSFKKCIGLNKKLPKKKLYGWIQELTPIQRADLAILRITTKLRRLGPKIQNEDDFHRKLQSIPPELKLLLFKGKFSIKRMKNETEKSRDIETGIKYGRAFGVLDEFTTEWCHWISGDLKSLDGRDKKCNRCQVQLDTRHPLNCIKLEQYRIQIEEFPGFGVSKILTDPFILNNLKRKERNKIQRNTALIVKTMIQEITNNN